MNFGEYTPCGIADQGALGIAAVGFDRLGRRDKHGTTVGAGLYLIRTRIAQLRAKTSRVLLLDRE